jgi:hypothetical protein
MTKLTVSWLTFMEVSMRAAQQLSTRSAWPPALPLFFAMIAPHARQQGRPVKRPSVTEVVQ